MKGVIGQTEEHYQQLKLYHYHHKVWLGTDRGAIPPVETSEMIGGLAKEQLNCTQPCSRPEPLVVAFFLSFIISAKFAQSWSSRRRPYNLAAIISHIFSCRGRVLQYSFLPDLHRTLIERPPTIDSRRLLAMSTGQLHFWSKNWRSTTQGF